ncbi:MAG: hypothetical protein JST39_18195 [Bacteroidetes bacterium]|nr:hypothetical protein [Bacteroidota bacterium]
MFKYCLTIFLSAMAIPGPHGIPVLPSPPQDGVPLAQIFDTKVTDSTVYTQQANKVYFVWGARSPRQAAGVVGAKYFPSMRNPDQERTIEWYKEHHPDWVMYQPDRTTPSYGFTYSYGGLVPLDISNPEVRSYYLHEFILPAVKQGYRMVAMDNVELNNWPKSAGHFSNGSWVQLYTAKKDDTAFHNAVIGWMRFLSDSLHPLGVGVCANIKANSASPEVVLRVMDAVDMWLDETGFTHTGKNITDAAWEKSFNLQQKISPVKACVSINQVDGMVSSAPASQLEWVVANFLLVRGPKSLLAVTGFEKKALYHRFDYRPEMNVNIGTPLSPARKDAGGAWTRTYSKGMVIVNPSSQATATLQLPKGKWKTIAGENAGSERTLAPATAVILNRE